MCRAPPRGTASQAHGALLPCWGPGLIGRIECRGDYLFLANEEMKGSGFILDAVESWFRSEIEKKKQMYFY